MTVTNYPVGDFLIRVKNASLAKTKEILVRKTNLIKDTAEAVKRLGFIDKISEKDGQLVVALTYKSKEPLLSGLKLISKPGLRIYKEAVYFQEYKGPAAFIVSTSKGVLTSDRKSVV